MALEPVYSEAIPVLRTPGEVGALAPQGDVMALASCRRCGATVNLNEAVAVEAHEQWHASLPGPPPPTRGLG